MFDHRHYVPILKSKRGEFWAIGALGGESRVSITPVFEIDDLPKPRKPKPTKKKAAKPRTPKPPATLASHCNNKCDQIANCWGTTTPLFIDTKFVVRGRDGAEVIRAIHVAARKAELRAIPVVSMECSEADVDEITSIAREDGRGVMLRLDAGYLGRPHLYEALLKHMGMKLSKIHLLLDYHGRAMDLASDAPEFPVIDEWASFSAASSAFPASVSGPEFPPKEWNSVKRRDWTSWKAGIESGDLSRLPAFSDYAIKTPGPPAGGGDPPVVMRYTRRDSWMVRRDGSHHKGGAPEMRTICKSLVAKPWYSRPEFSAGDHAIREIADGDLSTGGPTQWVQYALNHHIEYVIKKNLPSV